MKQINNDSSCLTISQPGENFKKVEIEVNNELLKTALDIHELITDKKMPILFSEDGTKAFINKTFFREPGERDTHSYKITIEKISYL